MRLVNSRFGIELELIENQVINLTIEDPEWFSKIVYDIGTQIEGGEGEFIYSNVEKELHLNKKAVLINNPLCVDCNEKKIITQIYKNLSDVIDKEFFYEFSNVNQEIMRFMDKVIGISEYNLDVDIDFQSSGLLKYCNVHIDSCYDTFADKFIDYLRALKTICKMDLVFVLNLKQYFSKKELEEIYKYCFYMKIYLINIEGTKTKPIEYDKYVIIDNDHCILDFSY